MTGFKHYINYTVQTHSHTHTQVTYKCWLVSDRKLVQWDKRWRDRMESKWLSKAHRYYHPNDWTINSNRKIWKMGLPLSLSVSCLSLCLSFCLPPSFLHPFHSSLSPPVCLSLFPPSLTMNIMRQNSSNEEKMKYSMSGSFFSSRSCWFSPNTYISPVTTPITIRQMR